MKKILAIALVIALLLIVACGSTTPEATGVDQPADTGTDTLDNADITEIDNLSTELDLSELDNLDAELDDLTW
jgi:uncharacterized protein YcfL